MSIRVNVILKYIWQACVHYPDNELQLQSDVQDNTVSCILAQPQLVNVAETESYLPKTRTNKTVEKRKSIVIDTIRKLGVF